MNPITSSMVSLSLTILTDFILDINIFKLYFLAIAEIFYASAFRGLR